MDENFENHLRQAIVRDPVEIPADTGAAIRAGRQIVRGRRVGWAVATCTVLAAAALFIPGVLQRGVPAVPAQPGATATASPASGRTLAGTDWNAERLQGAALRPGTSITLRFGDGWVEGFGGCNTFGYTTVDGTIKAGAYREDGDRLTIAPVATTAMGCANGVGDQEGRFLQLLPRVERFRVSSDGLVLQLFGADDVMLAQFESAAPKLERSGWRVTAVKGAPAVANPRQPTIVFLDGTLSGFDGCNYFDGAFTVNNTVPANGDVTITVRGITLKLCTDVEVTTQSTNLTSALEGASRAMVQGDQLTLLGTSGTPLLQATSEPTLMMAGVTWRLLNTDGRWGGGETSPITLVVANDQLSGNSGCGDYTAGFTHDRAAWSIEEPSVTPVPCPSDAGLIASRFLDLLTKVTRFDLSGNTHLRLTTPEETLTFSWTGR